MKSFLLALLLLTARPVFAQAVDHRLFYTGVAVTLTADIIDWQTTRSCVHDFPTRCHEANVVLRPIFDRIGPEQGLAGKLAVNGAMVGVLVVLHHLKPDWDRIITGSIFTMGGVQIVVDVSNALTLDRLRKGQR